MDPDSIDAVERVPHGGTTDFDVLDLSANINPRTPPGVSSVYAEALEDARRYPDDEFPDFRAAAASYVGCQARNVVPTPGGLAAIRLVLECRLDPGDTVLVPAPSFGEYAREVRLQGATPTFYPHDGVAGIETKTLERASVVIVCRPNNPTGELPEKGALEALIDRCSRTDTMVLVDEAFLGFTGEPSLATDGYSHVVVARSLTKLFGLPGIRAGFAVAFGPFADRLERARRAWTLGTPAAAVGAHCMRDEAFVRATRTRIDAERTRLVDALEGVRRYSVFPSDSPFILLELPDGDAVDGLLECARAANVVFRDARTFRRLDAHVRIAVRDEGATNRTLEVLTHADE